MDTFSQQDVQCNWKITNRIKGRSLFIKKWWQVAMQMIDMLDLTLCFYVLSAVGVVVVEFLTFKVTWKYLLFNSNKNEIDWTSISCIRVRPKRVTKNWNSWKFQLIRMHIRPIICKSRVEINQQFLICWIRNYYIVACKNNL